MGGIGKFLIEGVLMYVCGVALTYSIFKKIQKRIKVLNTRSSIATVGVIFVICTFNVMTEVRFFLFGIVCSFLQTRVDYLEATKTTDEENVE